MWIYFTIIALLILITWLTMKAAGGSARGFTSTYAEWDPPRVINDVLTRDECRYIMKKADGMFSPSTVVGKDGIDESRTSETAWISKTDPVAQKIFAKATELTGKPMECCEDLQVVRYKPGTFYRAHHDSCCDDTQACKDFEKRGGQRVATLLVYLNDDFEDGHTHFPDHGDLKLKADPGSAILFKPMGASESKCHPKALHAGLPISSGTKYVCNAWIRENKFV